MIRDLLKLVLGGDDIDRENALFLIQLSGKESLAELIRSAEIITRTFCGGRATLCAIVNAKSGLCHEDCAFCAQSVRFKTGVRRYPLLDASKIVERAKQAKEWGVHEFCIVTSGGSLTEQEFEKLVDILKVLKSEVEIQLDVSIGALTPERAKCLKEAGVTRVNHNLQTSPEFYPKIVTTHGYSARSETLAVLRESGLEICSGVILGLGETPEDRVRAALELRKFEPECVPINLLDPRPGTPLEDSPLLDPLEIIKTIAVFRFILPRTNLRLAGGRHLQLGGYQKLALRAGINGLIVGEYLTTQGGPMAEDLAYLREAEYEF